MIKSHIQFRLLLIIYCLLIITGSSIPGNSLPKVVTLTPDKLLHTIEYFILGVIFILWVKQDKPKWIAQYKYSSLFLFGCLFALFDEFWQSFIPGRFSDILDWSVDMLGILIAMAVFYWKEKSNDKSA